MDPDQLLSSVQDLLDENPFKIQKKSNKQNIQDQKDLALKQINTEKELNTNFIPTSFDQFSKGNVFGFKVLDKNDVVAFIERFYLQNQKLPNRPDFENNKSLKPLLPKNHEGWQDLLLEIEPSLRARGIPHYDTPLDFLEPNFILAVNLITNPYDKRPVASKLKDANITTKQWKNLLLKPQYLEFYQQHLDKIFDEQTQLDAKVGLQRLIANGDLAAIKHYQELQNIYRPQQNYNEVLATVLTAIIEILTIHVTPQVLGIVANEISQVINTTTSSSQGPVGSIERAS